MTVAHQAPLSTGFPRQEYWSEFAETGEEGSRGVRFDSTLKEKIKLDYDKVRARPLSRSGIAALQALATQAIAIQARRSHPCLLFLVV